MPSRLTLANVLGVPLDTALGQQSGWRVVFGVIAALAVAATLAIVAVLPHVTPAPMSSLADLRHLFNRQAFLVMGIATFGLGGMYDAFTYVALTPTGARARRRLGRKPTPVECRAVGP